MMITTILLLLLASTPAPPVIPTPIMTPIPVIVTTPAPAPPAPKEPMSDAKIGIIIAGVVTILGAFTAMIKELRSNTRDIAQNTKEGRVRGKTLHKVHLLTNSRLGAALKLLVRMTKKEADRTKDPDDIAAYQEALKELNSVQAGTLAVDMSESEEEDGRQG